MGVRVSSQKKRLNKSHPTPPTEPIEDTCNTCHSGHSSIIRQGRQFHNTATSSYWLPNDEEEMDRLVGQHFALKTFFDGNVINDPDILQLFDNGAKVLDVGCGPGTWVMDVATDFPCCECIGIDMSEVFPHTIRPSNVIFQSANVLECIPYPDNSIDFVNVRLLVMALRKEEWPVLLKEIFRVLKPGGYIQSTESGLIEDGNEFICRVESCVTEEMIERGQDTTIVYRLQEMMEDTKFCNIQQIKKDAYLGQQDHVNRALLWNIVSMFKSLLPILDNKLGVEPENYPVFVEQLENELQGNPATKWPFFITFAQKPLQHNE
ncbi:S-adenosyl-L-methionine-dependent methyltransferase [Spinellus fusiger]|nr:S-adenosyl-L-methionine-dependent methyltransferase [Spinellus fusiger]